MELFEGVGWRTFLFLYGENFREVKLSHFLKILDKISPGKMTYEKHFRKISQKFIPREMKQIFRFA